MNVGYCGNKAGFGPFASASADSVPGAGHFCREEKPDDYAALVAEWWANPAV